MVCLSLDISGNFKEGKGTTGWCFMKHHTLSGTGLIIAKNYTDEMQYYKEHLNLISSFYTVYGSQLVVVIEDYLLYAKKAMAQINSSLETVQLLGILKYYCWSHGIEYKIQRACDVKTRWTDEILTHKGYELPKYPGAKHTKDAIRHAVHFCTFYKEETK